MRYRIKEVIKNNGESYFVVQSRVIIMFWYEWVDLGSLMIPNTYRTLDEAEEVKKFLIDNEVKEI